MTHPADRWPSSMPDRLRGRASTIIRLVETLRHRGEPHTDSAIAGYLACSAESVRATRDEAERYGVRVPRNEEAGICRPYTGPQVKTIYAGHVRLCRPTGRAQVANGSAGPTLIGRFLYLFHRFAAPFRAISWRCSLVNAFALAAPPNLLISSSTKLRPALPSRAFFLPRAPHQTTAEAEPGPATGLSDPKRSAGAHAS